MDVGELKRLIDKLPDDTPVISLSDDADLGVTSGFVSSREDIEQMGYQDRIVGVDRVVFLHITAELESIVREAP